MNPGQGRTFKQPQLVLKADLPFRVLCLCVCFSPKRMLSLLFLFLVACLLTFPHINFSATFHLLPFRREKENTHVQGSES